MKSHADRIRHKGRNMIARKAEKHLKYCYASQRRHNDMSLVVFLNEEDAQEANLPRRVKSRVATFRRDLREGVVGMVSRIETDRFDKLERQLSKRSLSPSQLQQSREIQKSVRDILISYHSITQALDVIRHFNQTLLKRIEKAKGSKKTDLMLFNAILTYEITDMVVELLRNFELNGKEKLECICKAVEDELNKQQQNDDNLVVRIEAAGSKIKQNIFADIEERRRIREIVETKWNQFWARIDGLEQNIQEAGEFIGDLELVRDNARGQIDILQIVGVSQLVQSNLESLNRLNSVTDIQLAHLTADDVMAMIGQTSFQSKKT